MRKSIVQNVFFFLISQAPIPIKPWNGIRNAEHYGIKCPTIGDLKALRQKNLNNEDLEDCLNMAIFSTKVRWNQTQRHNKVI